MRNKPINQWGDECLRSILYDILITLLEYKWTELACDQPCRDGSMQRVIKFWTYGLHLLFLESCDYTLAGQCQTAIYIPGGKIQCIFPFFLNINLVQMLCSFPQFRWSPEKCNDNRKLQPLAKKNQPLYSVASWLTGAHHDEHMDHA